MDKIKKKYIFFGYIGSVGGSQAYMNNKTKYLRERGWDVHAFEPSATEGKYKIPWPELAGFKKNRIIAIEYPPDFWPKWYVDHTIKKIWKMSGGDADEFVIETITPIWAEWGELIAKRYSGKNFCFLMNEGYESYSGDRDFFRFKIKRGEVAFTNSRLVGQLIDGINDPDRYVLSPGSSVGAVEDVYNKTIDEIKKLDYNITYVGRLKGYADEIKKGVEIFSKKNPYKKIQLIIQGDLGNTESLEKIDNLNIIKLGYLVPIPKMLYDKTDVVIAGAGCACVSAMQNVPVIVANTKTHKAAGVLGYTISNTLMSDNPLSEKEFDEMIEDVLIKRLCDHLDFAFIRSENKEDYYIKQMSFLQNSSNEKKYFDFKKSKKREYKIGDIADFVSKFLYVRYRTILSNVWKNLHNIKMSIIHGE